jgi:uncharacterized protein (DUF697 family)
MYEEGIKFACDQLGFAKTANIRERILAALTSPYGEALVRTPVQASMGALAGLGTGYLVDKPGEGAALGALGGGMGGLAVAGAPKLRKAIIRALSGASHG